MTSELKFSAFDAAEYLTSEEDIAAYLNACAEFEDPALLLAAMGDVARARSMSALAKDADMSREGLYKALSPKGNPSFGSVLRVAKGLGVQVRFAVAPVDGQVKTSAQFASAKTPANPDAKTIITKLVKRAAKVKVYRTAKVRVKKTAKVAVKKTGKPAVKKPVNRNTQKAANRPKKTSAAVTQRSAAG